MSQHHADVIVLGLGPGGEEVAGRLAEAGLDVVGIEAELVGGECPYWGCIPSKMMIRAANALAEARRVPGLAGASSVEPDWAPVAARIRAEATDDWDDRVAVERLEGKGGRVVRGRGVVTAPGTVQVGEDTYVAGRGLVVATGTSPAIPPIEGLADTPYWTNRDAVRTSEVPESLLVLGGGAVGVELAQVFARFGSRVTVIEALDRLVPNEEPEAGALLAEVFEAEGIGVLAGTRATGVSHDGGAFAVTLGDGEVLRAERLLVATGRRADLRAIGMGALGLDEGARAIETDARLRAADGVWAVGDITGVGPFTHTAMYQARIAVADILGARAGPAEYHALPRVTFTDPEIGAVGLSEEAARDRGLRIRTGSTLVPHTARGWIHKAGNEGFIKVIADADGEFLIGATSMGPHGGEVLGFLALAVSARVPVTHLRGMIYAYPTFHRGIEDALRDLDAR